MDKLANVLDAVRRLSPEEGKRLMAERDALEEAEQEEGALEGKPLAALLALSATAHSEFADVSTNKYAHVASAILDSER